ncbi:MAG: hypothetical protein QF738_01185 [Rhodospirillales bacterium]|jgi:hypothetical protein|nr:hypothetical protein [Rhodospirillales bacterium]
MIPWDRGGNGGQPGSGYRAAPLLRKCRGDGLSGASQPFYGQDAQYAGKAPSYRDNGDGTVTDLTTCLMWSKAVELNKVSLAEAERIARERRLGGQTDWRLVVARTAAPRLP